MVWQERDNHGATTCDVCAGQLHRMAYGRRPVMADEELGVLVGRGGRLGLLLACNPLCAREADTMAGDTTPTRLEAK